MKTLELNDFIIFKLDFFRETYVFTCKKYHDVFHWFPLIFLIFFINFYYILYLENVNVLYILIKCIGNTLITDIYEQKKFSKINIGAIQYTTLYLADFQQKIYLADMQEKYFFENDVFFNVSVFYIHFQDLKSRYKTLHKFY